MGDAGVLRDPEGDRPRRSLDLGAGLREPACGRGHMASALREYFPQVLATDVHDHGWDDMNGYPLDFLSDAAGKFDAADWIATNPPFAHAEAFVRLGLQRAERGVAILARSTWLGLGKGRYPLFYGDTPLTLEARFFDRVTMTLDGRPSDSETATAYSWFVWCKPGVLLPPEMEAAVRALRGMPAHLTLGISPGTKARLTKPEDATFGTPRAKAWRRCAA